MVLKDLCGVNRLKYAPQLGSNLRFLRGPASMEWATPVQPDPVFRNQSQTGTEKNFPICFGIRYVRQRLRGVCMARNGNLASYPHRRKDTADRSRHGSSRINADQRRRPLGETNQPCRARRGGGNYGGKLLRDSALAATLLEASTATVSRTIALKRDGVAGIRNLQAYVFCAFLRRINRARRKDPILANATGANFTAHADPVDASKESNTAPRF